jgi:hypothetical protein
MARILAEERPDRVCPLHEGRQLGACLQSGRCPDNCPERDRWVGPAPAALYDLMTDAAENGCVTTAPDPDTLALEAEGLVVTGCADGCCHPSHRHE